MSSYSIFVSFHDGKYEDFEPIFEKLIAGIVFCLTNSLTQFS